MERENEIKYVAGDIVYEKVKPEVKLVVYRYIDRIYFCRLRDEPERKEVVLFERELF